MREIKITLIGVISLLFTQCKEARALVRNVPSSYEYKRNYFDAFDLKKSSTPFKFVDAQNEDLFKGKTIIYRGKEKKIEDLLKKDYTQSLLLIKNDSIIYEKYYRQGGKKVINNIWSESKSWGATLVAIAIKEGYLKMDDTILKYIPELKGKISENVTIKDLLHMRSSIVYDEVKGVFNPFSRLASMLYGDDLDNEIISRTEAEKVEPNTHWKYDTPNSHMLAMAVSRATNRHYLDYFNEKLWQPLHPEYDGLWGVDKKGQARSFCCLAITTRDDAKLGKLYLDGGKWNGEQLIPKWFVDEVVTVKEDSNGYYYSLTWRHIIDMIPLDEFKGERPTRSKVVKINGKKYLSIALSKGKDAVYSSGFLGNNMLFIPSINAIAVRHGNYAPSVMTLWPEILYALLIGSPEVGHEIPHFMELESLDD